MRKMFRAVAKFWQKVSDTLDEVGEKADNTPAGKLEDLQDMATDPRTVFIPGGHSEWDIDTEPDLPRWN